MKKLLIGTLVILLTAVGFQKLADSLDTSIKSKAVESERTIAANGDGGGMKPMGDAGGDKGKNKA